MIAAVHAPLRGRSRTSVVFGGKGHGHTVSEGTAREVAIKDPWLRKTVVADERVLF